MRYEKSRGTNSSPSIVSNGDYIGAHDFFAYGSSYLQVAGFGASVNGTVTSTSAPTDLFFYTTGGSSNADPVGNGLVRLLIAANGNCGVGVTSPTAILHLKAGTTAAKTAPLKFNSGSLMTSAEAGAVEFLTDKAYLTITTGAARKELTLNDGSLTSGRVPFVTTNGRLTDSANLTYASGTGITLAADNIDCSGTGQFFKADFINATLTSRFQFQCRTSNSSTVIAAVPSGSGTLSAWVARNNSDASAAHAAVQIVADTSVARLQSATANGGTALPLQLVMGSTVCVQVQTNNDVTLGPSGAATGMTAGFPYIPAAGGAPTGTPTARTGYVPAYYDTTNNKLYFYNGAWKSATFA
jgi:hypothetical protein